MTTSVKIKRRRKGGKARRLGLTRFAGLGIFPKQQARSACRGIPAKGNLAGAANGTRSVPATLGRSMRLVAPELVADLCGLSPGLLGAAAAIGAALWLLGWWSHRFWVVLIATVGAGVYGLFEAPILKAQPLIASLLLALAAGLLALALIRVFAFVAGGVVGLAAVQAFAPSADQPLIAFLVSGLLGLILFRWCVTGVMSFTGSLVLVYAGLAFLNQRGTLDATTYAENSGPLLSGVVGLMTVIGFALQLWQERRRRRDEFDEVKPLKKKPRDREEDFRGMFGRTTRKAG
jgi:hypothetical protein